MNIIQPGNIQIFLKERKGKLLTKKQLKLIFEFVDHRMQQAQIAGFQDGVEAEKKKHPAKDILRAEVAMTIQRLGDANAQIATSLSRMLEKL
jgi:hypothetical protein